MPRTLVERAVQYDGDLMVAAHEVMAELDDQDGVVMDSKAYRLLIRQKAREHKVNRRDLDATVRECI